MTDKEKWSDKIQALLKKAESTTPEEAELLFAKAAELMAKYSIDEAMLRAAGKKHENDKIVREEYIAVGIWLYPMGHLISVILRNFGMSPVKIKGLQREVNGRLYKKVECRHAVGYESDHEKARMMYTSLQIQALRAENTWWRETGQQLYGWDTPSNQHKERRQFLFSFAVGVQKQLTEATARGRAQAEAEHSKESVALVLRDRQANVDDAFKSEWPLRVKSRSRYASGGSAAAGAGYVAGQKADVGQPGLGSRRAISR